MGEEVDRVEFTRADRTRFRDQVHRNLDAFARMLRESRFDVDRPLTGVEIELNLVDEHHDPAMKNAEVLNAISDDKFQTELGRFNVEINVPPGEISGDGLGRMELGIRDSLNKAEAKANLTGSHLVVIGILPTLYTEHLSMDAISANPRYALLNDQVFAARGEDMHIAIEGVERLTVTAETILPEAACTSTQFHVQVSPEAFPRYWNAAQAVSGVQLAVGANSPFLFGKELLRETRIVLFEQSADTRSHELKTQGVRPRVWFGERWITSIFDLFEENARYFPALLPVCTDEDPVAVLDAGDVPRLAELKLHNGTIYRWNRPVYDVVRERPHLRVENRVLPAGPTVVDTIANGAFYFGLVRALAEDERPVWSQMSFSAAAENFHTAARHGVDAELFWPGVGTVPATELILRRLLPIAARGLDAWGVAAGARDRLLGIIEQRCLNRRNGAQWQADVFHQHYTSGNRARRDALRAMLSRYRDHMHTNLPVHEWPVD